MAVFTELTADEVAALLARYALGPLQSWQGIESGIENSNFFLTTAAGRHVLTVFERLTVGELPFYLGLMRHLAQRGLPVPQPWPTRAGSLSTEVRGKPVAIVSRLPGRAIDAPGPAHCAAVGAQLARMHLAAQDYAPAQPDPRGLAWCAQALARLRPRLPAAAAAALAAEIAFQQVHARDAGAALPGGPIHADLFRDNVLFDGERDTIGGVIDFYFAGCGAWLYDLAVTVNDWCVDEGGVELVAPRVTALLAAYHRVRPLTDAERLAWRAQLRGAALRFWLSRLYDQLLPRPAALLVAHDPARFERVLARRIEQPELPWMQSPP